MTYKEDNSVEQPENQSMTGDTGRQPVHYYCVVSC